MENQKQVAFQNFEAVYTENLSFWELIVFGKLYALIKSNDLDFCAYTLALSDFILDPTVLFTSISDAASHLLERRIKATYLDDADEIHVCQINLLTSVDIFSKNNEPSLVLTIHPRLKVALLAFKAKSKPFDFLELPILRFGSSLRLFAFLLQNMPKCQNSFTIEVEKLKDILGVSDKYSLYANFKIKVLEHAQSRLLQSAQTSFHFGEIKSGKKVSAIRFRMDSHPLLSLLENDDNPVEQPPILPKPKQEVVLKLEDDSPPKQPVNKDLIQKICEKIGVTQRMMRKLSEDFTEESLRQALVLTEKAIDKGSIKGSPAGYFVEAVRQNYQLPEEDEKEKKQVEALKKAEALAKIETEQRQLKENLKRQEFEMERDAILDELAKSSDLRQTITERIRYSIFHASYDISKSFNENLENPSFLAAVLNFYKIVR
jgi:hypothetical protein